MPSTRYKKGRIYSPDLAVYARLVAEDNVADLTRVKGNLARAMREEVTQRQRQALFLYYVKGMNMREAGQVMGVDRSTVSRTLKRAEARLRRCLRYGAASFLTEDP